ncbi:hypothetical protein [Stenotrophomonas acidaminiphila]
MDAEAVRRAAIVLAAMHPRVRARVLAGLGAAMRGRLSPVMDEVVRRGWNGRAMAMAVLASAPVADATREASCQETMALSDHLEPAALACVLQAEGMGSDDFQLAMMPASLQRELQAALTARGPMPPQLREATRAAARALLGELKGRGEHAPH